MFLEINKIGFERKIIVILDFENRFLPTYLPQCPRTYNSLHSLGLTQFLWRDFQTERNISM